MFEVIVLASGSSGNAQLVLAGGTKILVDTGLSARKLASHLEESGVRPGELDAILLTHEHGDHTSGLKVFTSKHDVPVFATRLTADALRKTCSAVRWTFFSSGSRFAIGEIEVQAFTVPHDASDPVGFVLRHGAESFGILTDLGYAAGHIAETVRGVGALFIEANYDERLLAADTKRPWPVRQRIQSRHGHLSNGAAAELVGRIATDALRNVFLGHLSNDCNTPELAKKTVEDHLSAQGLRGVGVHCIAQSERPRRFLLHQS